MSLVEIFALVTAASAVTVAVVAVLAWRRLQPLARDVETLAVEARNVLRRVDVVTGEVEEMVRGARRAGHGLGAVGALVGLIPPVRRAGAVLGALKAGWRVLRGRRAG